MINRIGERSKLQGFNVSRLPAFTAEEIAYIRGTWDFFGLNHYGSQIEIHSEEYGLDTPGFYNDMSTSSRIDPSWGTSAATWLHVRKL